MGGRLTAAIGRLRRDERGGALVMLGVALPALLMAAGVVIDYGMLSKQRTAFQTVADGSALAAAREFRLANATPTLVQSAAEKFATTQLKALDHTGTIAATVDLRKMTVTVEVTNVARTNIMHMFGSDTVTVKARATARVLGTASICVIGLEQKKNETIFLEKDAKLEAPECAVYSNSTSRDGLKAMNNSQLRARFICSAAAPTRTSMTASCPARRLIVRCSPIRSPRVRLRRSAAAAPTI